MKTPGAPVSPCLAGPARPWRRLEQPVGVGAHLGVEGLEVVAGDRREHVVLDVPVHAPEQELGDRVERDGSGVLAEVWTRPQRLKSATRTGGASAKFQSRAHVRV
jgi:hypothetical protein